MRERHKEEIRWAAIILSLLLVGAVMGYTAGVRAAQALQEDETETAPEPAQVFEAAPQPGRRSEPVPEPQPEAEPEPGPELRLIGTFTATAYCPCVKCCGVWSKDHPSRGEDYVQRTASGTIPEQGRTIAADWDILSPGSQVLINGESYTVEDTGSAVKGNRIDIYFDSHEAAREWGRKEVEVYEYVRDVQMP